jgi:hypothetical protein
MATPEVVFVKDKTALLIAVEMEKMLDATGLSSNQVFEALVGSPVPKAMRKYAKIGFTASWVAIFKSKPNRQRNTSRRQ